MNLVSRGVRNAFRNMIRTFSIVVILGLSMGLALSMLVANKAVGQKIQSVQSSVGNTVSVSPAGARGFEGGGNALTETTIDGLAKINHVTSVEKTLSDRLTTSNTNLVSAVDAGNLGSRFLQNSGQGFNLQQAPPVGRRLSTEGSATVTRTFTPPITVRGTTSPSDISSASNGGGTFKLTGGSVFSKTSNDNMAVIGTTLATKNNLKVGSTFTAYGTPITVLGIFDAGNAFSNNQVLMPLKAIQTLSGQAGQLTAATINVDSVTNVDGVTSAVGSKLGSTADVTNAAETAKTTIAPLKNIQTISLYSLIGAVAAGAVIILLTMIMIVRERRREIGVVKAIGASNLKVMGQFTVEAITLTTLAAMVGIAIGALASSSITKMLVASSSTASTQTFGGFGRRGGFGASQVLNSVTGVVGWDIILYGLLAAVLIAVVGSALASFFIAKVRPAEVMRAD